MRVSRKYKERDEKWFQCIWFLMSLIIDFARFEFFIFDFT